MTATAYVISAVAALVILAPLVLIALALEHGVADEPKGPR